METIDILVTLNERYLEPLKVLILSLHHNNPQSRFQIWLLHKDIPEAALTPLAAYLEALGSRLQALHVDPSLLQDAPIMNRYPEEMYYRLLCGQVLPESVERVLYLDPDILVINPLTELWHLDLGSFTLAAATHSGLINVAESINNVRLQTKHGYYNSGVLVIDVSRFRNLVKLDAIVATSINTVVSYFYLIKISSIIYTVLILKRFRKKFGIMIIVWGRLISFVVKEKLIDSGF